MEDQVITTSNSEVTAEQTQVQEEAPAENKEQTVEQQIFKTFNSEEDYNKAMQSERSKAKYELLKELGISNVDEFRTLKQSYDDGVKEKDTLTAQVNELSTKLQLKEIGVADDKVEQFKALAKTFMKENQTYKDISEDIKSQYPQLFRTTKDKVNIGTDISESTNDRQVSDRYKGYTFRH